MHRSLPRDMSSKGNIRESLLFKGSPKQSRQSSEIASSLLQQEPAASFKTDSPKRPPTTKKSVRLSDLMAAMYPGIKVGHQYCVQRSMLVPKTMGWLWNTEDTVVGVPFPRGYRPGAIALGVKRNIRQRSIIEPLTTPIGVKGKKTKGKRIKTTSSTIPQSPTESVLSVHEKKIPPTLYVHKEKGVYRVTMQPICVPQQMDGEEEKPVQLKIADSASRHSGTSKSSSTIKIEYMCTGARRKPIKKPELAEISTQWDILDLTNPEPDKKEEQKESVEVKKIKVKKPKLPKKDKTKVEKVETTTGEKENNEVNLADNANMENVTGIQEENLLKEKRKNS